MSGACAYRRREIGDLSGNLNEHVEKLIDKFGFDPEHAQQAAQEVRDISQRVTVPGSVVQTDPHLESSLLLPRCALEFRREEATRGKTIFI